MRVKTLISGLVAAWIIGAGTSLDTAFAQKKASDAKQKAMLERGKYLVTVGGCHDCHSPKIMTPKGPEPDPARLLSGHPADENLPSLPAGVISLEGWGAITNHGLTAWVGPWGTSFARNLTPDVETGLGSWTPEIFIKALRTGKDMGEGRDILPPMPWFNYAEMSDDDLKAVFAHLQSMKPIHNAVPDPISPTGETMPTLAPGKK